MNETVKNFSISGKEDSLEKIISKLKFISKINEGEKIEVKTMTVIEPDVPSRIYRTFISRESRIETFEFLKNVVNMAIDIMYYYFGCENSENFNVNIVELLVNNLMKAKKGMKNLIVTYKNDRKFVSDIETLIETMDTKIKINNKFAYELNEMAKF